MYQPEEKYMRRALQLASYGAGFVSPNPMVGAVIVSPDGRIIGQGWHRRYGGPHAEVNAVGSVRDADRSLLPQSTIYVTLEPCSHYGKTPPCSLLLIREKLRRVVIGSPDPFPLVAGRGVRMLREAGIEVIEGFMQEECDFLNRRFITAHTLRRPWIILKWAQSADGFMAALPRGGTAHGSDSQRAASAHGSAPAEQPLESFRDCGKRGCASIPVRFSGPVSAALMHAQRALVDAILVGTNTLLIDRPSLTVRHWPGRSPRPVLFRLPDQSDLSDRSDKSDWSNNSDNSYPSLPSPLRERKDLILLSASSAPRHSKFKIQNSKFKIESSLPEQLHHLYTDHSITSLMVEGGPATLRQFISLGLYDAIRIEIAPVQLGDGLPAPALPFPI